MFIYILIPKCFLNTRSRQSSFLLANQNAHLITHEPMKFRVTKVKIKFKFVESASGQASVVKILLYLWKISKCPKFGENRRKVQNIYYSVRKELLDECHCARSLLKVTSTCPIWQPEKMVEVESLIVLCEVLLVRNHSTSSGPRLLKLLLLGGH